MYKLEVAFVQGNAPASKLISKFSQKLINDQFTGDFHPSHVLLVLDDSIVFESSTYKKSEDKDAKHKIYEKGTRILDIDDIDERLAQNSIKRVVIDYDLDPYLALKYVAQVSNYKYSYKSIFKFLINGHLKRKKNNRRHVEYICSGLVLEALREDYFKKNAAVQKVINQFKGIDSNSVTPLDLYLAFCKAGYTFRECKGLINETRNL